MTLGPSKTVIVIGTFLLLGSACSTPASPLSSGIDPEDPGQVAIAYTLAATRGDFDTAKSFVRAEDQGIVDALALGAKGTTGTTASGNISVGRVFVAGDTAKVSWVGQLCRVPKTSKEQPSDCIQNDDPAAESPLYLISLARDADGHWLVALGGS